MSDIVTVVGIGEDGLDGLGAAARAAVLQADIVIGGERHLAMLPVNAVQQRWPWNKDIAGTVERIAAEIAAKSVVVLASGEPLWHGIGARLIARFGLTCVRVLPTAGAFSLAAARIGWSLDDPMLACVSVHALPFEALTPHISPLVKLLILSRSGTTPSQIAAMLTERGYGDSRLSVLERMGGSAEGRRDGRAADEWPVGFDNLSVVAVLCVAGADAIRQSRAPGLADDDYLHDGTITKRDIRAVTLSALAPLPGEMLWDVGAGNGSIAIEWLRLCPSAHATAIERDPARAARISENAKRLGVPGVTVIEGVAPASFGGLPAPDAIFIGGGLAETPELLKISMTRLKQGGRIVANAVTLEAEAELLSARARFGGELVRIGISRDEALGGLRAMKPAIDVLQWRGRKP